MSNRLLNGLKFYLGFAPKFSRKGFERRGLSEQPVDADFSGQRWLVTGASGGIGREIVAQAVSRGARVAAVARSEAKLQSLNQELDGPGEVDIRPADLSLRRDVSDFTGDLADDGRGFDVLVNNVGVLLNEHLITDEGFEASFAINLLNHFVLTEELISHGLLARNSTVINMSSGGMYTTALLPDELNVTDSGGSQARRLPRITVSQPGWHRHHVMRRP